MTDLPEKSIRYTDYLELKDKVSKYEYKYGPLIEKRGLQNWRNLFKKPNLQDWIVTFLIVMLLVLGFAYKSETDQCRVAFSNLTESACTLCDQSKANDINSGKSFVSNNHQDDVQQGILIPEGLKEEG